MGVYVCVWLNLISVQLCNNLSIHRSWHWLSFWLAQRIYTLQEAMPSIFALKLSQFTTVQNCCCYCYWWCSQKQNSTFNNRVTKQLLANYQTKHGMREPKVVGRTIRIAHTHHTSIGFERWHWKLFGVKKKHNPANANDLPPMLDAVHLIMQMAIEIKYSACSIAHIRRNFIK